MNKGVPPAPPPSPPTEDFGPGVSIPVPPGAVPIGPNDKLGALPSRNGVTTRYAASSNRVILAGQRTLGPVVRTPKAAVPAKPAPAPTNAPKTAPETKGETADSTARPKRAARTMFVITCRINPRAKSLIPTAKRTETAQHRGASRLASNTQRDDVITVPGGADATQ